MRETEWDIFMRHVPAGCLVREKYESGFPALEGILLENYPYVDEERADHYAHWPYLRVQLFDNPDVHPSTFMPSHLYYSIWDGWYDMDDILMAEDMT